jgi:hypothetical protein
MKQGEMPSSFVLETDITIHTFETPKAVPCVYFSGGEIKKSLRSNDCHLVAKHQTFTREKKAPIAKKRLNFEPNST